MGGAAERLGAQDLWVSRVGRKDLTPGVLPPGLGPLDADAFHRSAPRPSPSVGPSVHEEPRSSLGLGLRGRYEPRVPWSSPEGVPEGVESSGATVRTKVLPGRAGAA